MTREAFRKMIVEVFLPAVERRRADLGTPGAPALLICDGHCSRHHPETLESMMAANVAALILPPHSSHPVQPLDKLFGHFKDEFAEHLRSRLASAMTPAAQRLAVANALVNATATAFTPSNIWESFCTIGLLPPDPNRILSHAQFTLPSQAPSKDLDITTCGPLQPRRTPRLRAERAAREAARELAEWAKAVREARAAVCTQGIMAQLGYLGRVANNDGGRGKPRTARV